MIKIGGEIGALNTIALIFLTAITGIYYARIQGIQTLRSGIINLYQNKVPIYELVSGASIAFAAVLLIIPGFITDLIGFIILIPFTRRVLFKIALRGKTTTDKHKEKIDAIDGEIVKKEKDEL